MYDYATSVYEKRKICCINTKISRFITTAFPQTVATTPHYSSGIINRKGQEDQSLQRLLAIFPTISSDPDRAVLPTSFLMPIIKRKTRKERWLAISAISDLKLAKRKYFTAESGVLLYEEGDIDRAYQYIQRL
jgi:hypothetical protein